MNGAGSWLRAKTCASLNRPHCNEAHSCKEPLTTGFTRVIHFQHNLSQYEAMPANLSEDMPNALDVPAMEAGQSALGA